MSFAIMPLRFRRKNGDGGRVITAEVELHRVITSAIAVMHLLKVHTVSIAVVYVGPEQSRTIEWRLYSRKDSLENCTL